MIQMECGRKQSASMSSDPFDDVRTMKNASAKAVIHLNVSPSILTFVLISMKMFSCTRQGKFS